MIVATRTADGQAHERPAQRVELFVDDVHFHFDGIVLGQHLGTNGQETRGKQPVLHSRDVTGRLLLCHGLLTVARSGDRATTGGRR